MSRLLKHFSRRMVSSKKAKDNEHQSRLSASVTDEQPLEIFTTLPGEAPSAGHSTPGEEDARAQSSTQEDVKNACEQQEDDPTNCRDEECYEFEPVFDDETQRYQLSELPHQTIEPPRTTDKIPLKTLYLKERSQTNEEMNLTGSVHPSKEVELQKDQNIELTRSSSILQSKKPSVSGTSNTHETSPVSEMPSTTPSQEVPSSEEASRRRSSEEQELSLVKRASEELLKLLTDPELADELAVECAEKALQRYISPIMQEQELKVITEAEKALEEELLGLDKDLVQKLPKEVDACLSRRARAITAAETVARGDSSTEGETTQQSLSKRSSLQTHVSKGSSPFGYADMADLARGVGASFSDVMSSTSPPHPSHVPSPTGSESPDDRVKHSPMKAMLSRRFASFKHLDEVELTAVYDRTYSWLKRSESKIADARNDKEETNMKECSFKPNIIQHKSTNLKCSTIPQQDSNTELESVGSGVSTMDKACLRLYEKAREMHSKKYQQLDDFLCDEKQALQAASPRARPMPKSVYGDIFPAVSLHRGFSSKLRPLPSGIEECTFHPKTNVKRTWTIPNKNRRTSYWNLDNINVSSELDNDFENGLSKQSSNYATFASLDSDLAAAMETVSNEDKEQTTHVEDNATHDTGEVLSQDIEKNTDIRSPDDLMNVFLEHLSKSKPLPKSSPTTLKTRKEHISKEQGYQTDSKILQRKHEVGTAEKHHLTQFAGECKLMTDVDFSEFLRRQEQYLLLKNRRIQAMRNKKEDSVQLSPGTRRILKEKNAQFKAARSDTGSFIRPCSAQSVDGSVTSYPLRRTQSRNTHGYDKECSFSPKITKKAQRLKPRSIDDFTKRNTRTQNLIEARRLEQEMNEISELTFRPKLSNKLNVPSRLNLKDPEAYMHALREREARRYLKASEAEHKRAKEELSQCTFHPRITTLPSSMKRELERSKQPKGQDSIEELPSWGYATKLQTTSML